MPLVRDSGKTPPGTAPAIDIVAALVDQSAETRFKAAREAADHPETAHALTAAISSETDTRVRSAIFSALSAIATPESVAAIVACVRSDDAGLRVAAMDTLRASPQLIAVHLEELLSDPDSDVRLLACDLARNLDGEFPTQILCRLLDNEQHPNVCAMAVEVLGEIGDAGIIAPLARCAARFPDDPFLLFAIETVSARLKQRQPRG